MLTIVFNLIWLFFAGFWLALTYVGIGLALFITIIGIPFGIQAFKLAVFAVWPFGRVVVPTDGSSSVVSGLGNLIWVVLVGWWLALLHVLLGLLLCITIIGIPFGLALFKMTGLALWPFGRTIVDAASLLQIPPGSYTVATPPPASSPD